MALEHVIERSDFDRLFEALSDRGHTIVGPTVRDQAIVYDEIRSVADLPVGWTDEQDGGRYRLRRRDDEALFGYAVGPHSWKKLPAPPAGEAVGGAHGRARCARRRDRTRRGPRTATRSSEPARASCTRWGCSIACSSAGRTLIRPIAQAPRARSSSPFSADRRAVPASASR